MGKNQKKVEQMGVTYTPYEKATLDDHPVTAAIYTAEQTYYPLLKALKEEKLGDPKKIKKLKKNIDKKINDFHKWIDKKSGKEETDKDLWGVGGEDELALFYKNIKAFEKDYPEHKGKFEKLSDVHYYLKPKELDQINIDMNSKLFADPMFDAMGDVELYLAELEHDAEVEVALKESKKIRKHLMTIAANPLIQEPNEKKADEEEEILLAGLLSVPARSTRIKEKPRKKAKTPGERLRTLTKKSENFKAAIIQLNESQIPSKEELRSKLYSLLKDIEELKKLTRRESQRTKLTPEELKTQKRLVKIKIKQTKNKFIVTQRKLKENGIKIKNINFDKLQEDFS